MHNKVKCGICVVGMSGNSSVRRKRDRSEKTWGKWMKLIGGARREEREERTWRKTATATRKEIVRRKRRWFAGDIAGKWWEKRMAEKRVRRREKVNTNSKAGIYSWRRTVESESLRERVQPVPPISSFLFYIFLFSNNSIPCERVTGYSRLRLAGVTVHVGNTTPFRLVSRTSFLWYSNLVWLGYGSEGCS